MLTLRTSYVTTLIQYHLHVTRAVSCVDRNARGGNLFNASGFELIKLGNV